MKQFWKQLQKNLFPSENCMWYFLLNHSAIYLITDSYLRDWFYWFVISVISGAERWAVASLSAVPCPMHILHCHLLQDQNTDTVTCCFILKHSIRSHHVGGVSWDYQSYDSYQCFGSFTDLFRYRVYIVHHCWYYASVWDSVSDPWNHILSVHPCWISHFDDLLPQ